MTAISIVSGTVNRIESLKRMVASVRTSVGAGVPYEIVLVDNNSTDGTYEWCGKQSDVRYFNIGEPRGACPAFNMGFTNARGEYVVASNDDIEFDGDTIRRSYEWIKDHPDVGQVAYAHKYMNRPSPHIDTLQHVSQYLYGQCCITRRSVGNAVGWWGDGLVSYGGDARLSMRIWEIGFSVVGLGGCRVIDYEIDDAIRKRFSHDMRSDNDGKHPDTTAFFAEWRGRLPDPKSWQPAPVNIVLSKAANRTLRTLRVKGTMNPNLPPRVGCIHAFGEYGPSFQIDKGKYGGRGGTQLESQFRIVMNDFRPDLVMLQEQGGPNSMSSEFVRDMVERYPDTFIFNWDGDTHYPLKPYHFDIAKAARLQLLISPSYFPIYLEHGVEQVGYWPIGVEQEFIEITRSSSPGGPDVLFLGSLYSENQFPGTELRKNAVLALSKSGLKFQVFGVGWDRAGLSVQHTLERHVDNARRYAQAKMALTMSQTTSLWGYTSDRLYNIVATGCPALTQRFDGMEEHGFVDNDTCIAWTTIPEMLERARWYTKRDQERERVGAAGRRLLLSRHTWPHRVRGLFTMLADLQV